MSSLDFHVESAHALTHAAAPTIVFKLRVTNLQPVEPIQSVMLQTQIQIEALRRKYTEVEKRKLQDLFGEPERWNETLRTTYWTTVHLNTIGFVEVTTIDLQVPCSFDFNIAATKYFAGLEDGEIPLSFLFSGTVFYSTDDGLQIDQISWSKESKFRLPVSVWQEMMNHYYPNGAWLRLRRDVFDRLLKYKIDQGIPSWESVIDNLLVAIDAENGRMAPSLTSSATTLAEGVSP
jgi:hypothetical protein